MKKLITTFMREKADLLESLYYGFEMTEDEFFEVKELVEELSLRIQEKEK